MSTRRRYVFEVFASHAMAFAPPAYWEVQMSRTMSELKKCPEQIRNIIFVFKQGVGDPTMGHAEVFWSVMNPVSDIDDEIEKKENEISKLKEKRAKWFRGEE